MQRLPWVGSGKDRFLVQNEHIILSAQLQGCFLGWTRGVRILSQEAVPSAVECDAIGVELHDDLRLLPSITISAMLSRIRGNSFSRSGQLGNNFFFCLASSSSFSSNHWWAWKGEWLHNHWWIGLIRHLALVGNHFWYFSACFPSST